MKYNNYKEYQDASTNIFKLAGICDTQHVKAQDQRQQRRLDIDLDSERRDGYLAPDELYIPTHIIDSNIKREQAKYVSYIVNSRRTVIFSSSTDPAFNTGPLERDFTERCRYDGWQVPLFRTIDCMQLHGYCVAEVQFDDTKPGHFAVESVNYEDLAFPDDTREIQACGMVVHRHYFTREQLIDMTKTREFSKKEVESLVGKEPVDEQTESLLKIEKVMFRDDGIVQVGWSCVAKCNDWLRKPRPLFLGKRDLSGEVYETDYPYVIFYYMIAEDMTIKNCVGRAYLDRHAQEAVSSLMSSFVTAHRRASNFYFSKETDDPNQSNEQTNVQFVPGALIDANIRQFQLTPPNSAMLSAIQTLITQNSQEQSQMNYAAMNRQDSRKTATEIQTATAEAQLLSATQVALFSISIKKIYEKCWEIYRSRVLDGLIEPTVPLQYFTDHEYNMKPAGDTDVVERQEKAQRMLQVWPVIQQNSALAVTYMKDMLSMLFPDEAPKYIEQMQEDHSKTQLLQQMSAIIDSLIIDPQTGQLTQEAQPYAQQLQALQQQVQQLSGGDQKGAGGTGMAAMGGQPNNPNLSVVAKEGAGAAG
jgi:hypothetical protein